MRHMGMTMTFMDSLKLPEGVWYFAATNAKEQLFQEYPQITFPDTKKGCPRKLPVLSQQTKCAGSGHRSGNPMGKGYIVRRGERPHHRRKKVYPVLLVP